MKRSFLGALMVVAAATAFAQGDYVSSRIGPAADQLKRATSRLAERTLQNVMRSASNSRSQIQEASLAQHIDGSATLLVEMVRNRRPGVELRDVGAELSDLLRRAPASSPEAGLWRQVQTAAADFNRELGGSGRGQIPGPSPRPIIGRVSWRGTVDDRVQLAIRGKSIEVRTISGAPNRDGVANFTTAVPDGEVEVGVTKISGRGTVEVLQQPSRANDYTAVIEIYDAGSGAKEYRLDIFWR